MDREAPEGWIGKLVQIAVVSDERFTGRMEAANLYGITFQPQDAGGRMDDPPPAMFLPWPSILWVVLAEG